MARKEAAPPESTPGWEDLSLHAHILGFHSNEGILEVDPHACSLQPVAWALAIREECAERFNCDLERPMLQQLPNMTATARMQLNLCCEWQQSSTGKELWMITAMPWTLTESARSRSPPVDSQTAMKNLKTFGRYLFSDENIMYVIFILGRAPLTGANAPHH